MIRTVAAAMILAASIATPVAAQQLVPVGVRVRVTLSESRRQAESRVIRTLVIRGEVTAASAESLWIRPTRVTGALGISNAGIRMLQQSRGAPSRVRSLFIDGIGGAIAGAIEGALLYHAFGTDFSMGDATTRGKSAANGATYGAAIFGVIGFLLPVEYWRRIPLD